MLDCVGVSAGTEETDSRKGELLFSSQVTFEKGSNLIISAIAPWRTVHVET